MTQLVPEFSLNIHTRPIEKGNETVSKRVLSKSLKV